MTKNSRKLDPELLRALIAAPTLARRLYNGGATGGLEARAMQVLIAVEILERPAVKDVASELAMPHKTASALLTKLSDQGLIRTEAEPADQRLQVQLVTDSGRVAIAGFAAKVASYVP